MSPLLKYLKDLIRQSGHISVAEYMEICLYHSEYGYYRTKDPIGTHGDFITAPEISQVFGELIGAWFTDLWLRINQPSRFNLIELGPGKGTLLQDLLRVAPEQFKKALNLHLVEINQVLQKCQRQKLNNYQTNWHTSIDSALMESNDGPIFVIANEFFDALPIHQFSDKGEKVIVFDQQKKQLAFDFIPSSQTSLEICPLAEEIMKKLTEGMCKLGGAALIIDYGYTSPSENHTLQSVKNHQYHDILSNPGEADLTAHVDFRQLIDTAFTAGGKTYGPTIQGDFLTELGIHTRAQQLKTQNQSIHRLTSYKQMGTLFKVMAVTSPTFPHPCGFSTCLKPETLAS